MKFRSVSPVLYQKNVVPPGRSSSPFNVVQNANHSPQISRVIVREKTPIIFSNLPMNEMSQISYRTSTTPVKDERKPLSHNYTTLVGDRKQVRPVSPINIHQKPQLFTLHQNVAQNYSTSPCRIKVEHRNSNQTTFITPSPMRYYQTNNT